MFWFVLIIFTAIFTCFTYLLFSIFSSRKSMKINGVSVTSVIKNIEIIKKKDKKNNIYDGDVILECEFEYNGNHVKKMGYDSTHGVLKVGDKLECIYNPKNDTLATRESEKNFGKLLFIAFLIPLFMLTWEILSRFFPQTDYIVFALAFVFFFIIGFILYKKGKFPENSELVNGVIKDVIKKQEKREHHTYYTYTPVYEFTYNGNTYTHVSTMGSSSESKYKIGEPAQIFYNPMTKKCMAKGESNDQVKLGLSFMIFTVVVGLIVIISLLVQ